MAVKYVKFERGTLTDYTRVKNAHRLSDDTLYFIYDADHPEDVGRLYMGYTLISGTSGTGGSGATALSELNDVSISSVTGGMILQYNTIQAKWVATSLKTALINLNIGKTVTGSTEDEETVAQALNRLNTTPYDGNIAIINGNSYIYDGTTWQVLTNKALEDRVATLESDLTAVKAQIITINNNINSINNRIDTMNHLSYQVVDSLDNIDTSSANLNLTKTVYLVRNENEEIASSEVGDLYDEYLYVGSNFERLGGWTVDLSNYVTTDIYENDVSNLQDQLDLLSDDVSGLQTTINALDLSNYVLKTDVGNLSLLRVEGKENTTVVDEILELQDRLTWGDIAEAIANE